MENLQQASALRAMLSDIVREVVREETRDCLRVYKAVVTSAPNGSVCSVRLVGDTTVLSLPYSSKVANVSAGSVVWVAVLFGNLRNGIVWETSNFR